MKRNADSPAWWLQDRAAFLSASPRVAALVRPIQQAHFGRSRLALDPLPGAGADPVACPSFAGNQVLVPSDPGTRVDHYVRRLTRAHTALSLALDQPFTALWPLARTAAWRKALWSRHHAPLVRSRGWVDRPELDAGFNGALCFRPEAAQAAVQLWFWAERMGVFPQGLVSVWELPGGALVMNLCGYGNLHVAAYGAAALAALSVAAQDAGWSEVQGLHCASAWQRTSAIPGRVLTV